MAFTQETIDFSQLSEKEIKSKLSELNIPLTATEVLKVQKDMLKRPPSLAELVLFSIQGSEHCSYKSSRNHLKTFTTEGPDVVLGAKEDAGVVSGIAGYGNPLGIPNIGGDLYYHSGYNENCLVTLVTFCLLYTSPSPRD